MTERNFVIWCVLLFAFVGPLVPLVATGLEKAVTRGDSLEFFGAIAFAPFAYLFGITLAAIFGVVTAFAFVTMANKKPGLQQSNWVVRLLIAVIATAVAYLFLALIVGSLGRHIRFAVSGVLMGRGLGSALVGLWRLQREELQFLGLPTLVCASWVALALWPRLAARPPRGPEGQGASIHSSHRPPA